MAASSTSGLGYLNISPNTGDLAEIVRVTRYSQEYWLCLDWPRRGEDLCDPPFCRAASGHCCLLIASNRGVVCPYSC